MNKVHRPYTRVILIVVILAAALLGLDYQTELDLLEVATDFIRLLEGE